MGDFTTAEAAGDLHLVARLDEAANRTHLDVEIVIVRLRTDLDLLHLDDGLLLLRFAELLLLFVLELTEVENLADRRYRLGVHLDQVEAGFLSAAQRLLRGKHAQVTPVLGHHAHLWHADSVVHADLRSARVPAEAPASGSTTHCHVRFTSSLRRFSVSHFWRLRLFPQPRGEFRHAQ